MIFKNNKNEVFGNVDEWIPIKEIGEKQIVLKDLNKIRILEVEPINFKLKSTKEQLLILENFRRFFKTCDFDIQIVIQSRKADVSKHINEVKNNSNNDAKLKEMIDDYIRLIKEMSDVKGSICRKYYIIIKEETNVLDNIQKIKNGLECCGNIVCECDYNALIKILSTCLNKRLSSLED